MSEDHGAALLRLLEEVIEPGDDATSMRIQSAFCHAEALIADRRETADLLRSMLAERDRARALLRELRASNAPSGHDARPFWDAALADEPPVPLKRATATPWVPPKEPAE